MSDQYGVAMGIKRGTCQEVGCKNCPRYRAADDVGEGGGPCLNCGHFPGNHENLGPDEASADGYEENGKIMYDDPDPLGLLAEPGNTETEEDMAVRRQLQELCEWGISGNELRFLEKLGSGRSAKVYKGLYKNEVVAIKVLKSALEPKELRNFKGELDIMSTVHSSHIVKFYGGCLQPRICLVMEYCSNGSLYHLMQRKEFPFDWPLFFRLAIETVEGVLALHSMEPPIVHRDLKSLNLLVNSEYSVKVCDFGLSRMTQGSQDDSTLGKLRGTYAYSAPEVYKGDKYSDKSDVFSVGIIIWELIARLFTNEYQRPYKEYNFKIDFQIIINTAKNGSRPKVGMDITPENLRNLITRCWSPKPDDRPPTREVLQSLIDIRSEYEANKAEWDPKIGILAKPVEPAPAATTTTTTNATVNASPNTSSTSINTNNGVHSGSNVTLVTPTATTKEEDTGPKWAHKGIDDFLRKTEKTPAADAAEKERNRKSLPRSLSKKTGLTRQPTKTELDAESPSTANGSATNGVSEVRVEVASPWVRMGDWRAEDAFDEEPKKKPKKKGRFGISSILKGKKK